MPSNQRVRDTHLPHIRLLLLAIRTICFTLFAGAMVIHEAMVPIVLLAFFCRSSQSRASNTICQAFLPGHRLSHRCPRLHRKCCTLRRHNKDPSRGHQPSDGWRFLWQILGRMGKPGSPYSTSIVRLSAEGRACCCFLIRSLFLAPPARQNGFHRAREHAPFS